MPTPTLYLAFMAAGSRLRVAMTLEQCWERVPGGSGTYVRELLREYATLADVSVTGLLAWHGVRAEDETWRGVRLRRAPLPRTVLYEAWHKLRLPREGTGQDVVHATTWAIPGHRAPLVVTVHDLAFRHEPDHFTPRGLRFFERGLELTRDEAAAVIVPSSVTRGECLAAGIEAERLHLVPHGVRTPLTTGDDVAGFRRRFDLTRPYVLWAGTREPRKNLPRLLAAFGHMVDAGADVDLVLVGPDGWGPEHARLNDVQQGRVRILGRLSRPDLDAAYAGALVFCYPSLREGFGMPVTEAMAHGTPVVTSRGTATEEAAGGAALLVDPTDDAGLARALLDACTPECQASLRQKSRRRAAELDWSRAARDTVAVLNQAAGRQQGAPADPASQD